MLECASGACREATRDAGAASELLSGAPSWSSGGAVAEYGPAFADLQTATSEALRQLSSKTALERLRSLASGISTVGRKISSGYDSEPAIRLLSDETRELRSALIRSLVVRREPKEQVKTMVLIGFLRNLEGSVRGLKGVNEVCRNAPQVVRDRSALMAEASVLAAKSFSAFLSFDKSMALDAQSDFKLFTMSLGSREGLGLRPECLWSLCQAVNAFYSIRLLVSLS